MIVAQFEIKNAYSDKGLYAYYFRDERVGIKVLRTGSFGQESKEERENEAKREFALLTQAFPSGMTPEPYKVECVFLDGCHTAAIYMEHIEGVSLAATEEEENCIMQELSDTFYLRTKIMHCDLHTNNVIVTGKESYKIIDFTPENIHRDD